MQILWVHLRSFEFMSWDGTWEGIYFNDILRWFFLQVNIWEPLFWGVVLTMAVMSGKDFNRIGSLNWILNEKSVMPVRRVWETWFSCNKIQHERRSGMGQNGNSSWIDFRILGSSAGVGENGQCRGNLNPANSWIYRVW